MLVCAGNARHMLTERKSNESNSQNQKTLKAQNQAMHYDEYRERQLLIYHEAWELNELP